MRGTLVVLTLGVSLVLAGCSRPDYACECSTGILVITGPLSGPPAVSEIADNGPYNIDFGAVAVGMDSSAPLAFVDTGTSPLAILSVGPPTDPEFGLTLTAGSTIQSGSKTDVPVSFKPFSAGAKSATIVIQTDSVATQTVTLNLSGTGVH